MTTPGPGRLTRPLLSPKERELYSQLRRLVLEPGVVGGSVSELRRRCGNPGCHCAREARFLHRSLYIMERQKGKVRAICVPRVWEERVLEWAIRYRKIQAVLKELSHACVERVRSRSL